MQLTKEEKNKLLNIAEWAICNFLKNKERRFEEGKFDLNDVICQNAGAFVSVYSGQDLRGCMGTFSESERLCENVHQMAIQAAFDDRRFDPLTDRDLEKLKTEISVLTPRKPIKSPDEIIIGKHGIYMIQGYRRATLLPQVAVNNNWSVTEFLECCAKNKLGLSKNSWKDAELFTYEALVFS